MSPDKHPLLLRFEMINFLPIPFAWLAGRGEQHRDKATNTVNIYFIWPYLDLEPPFSVILELLN